LLGYPLGVALAMLLCRRVFDLALTAPGWLFPIAVSAAVVVAVCGSLLPLRQALTEQPVRSLRN
jgi:ABC-type antimicrobial peptide transport system permease subunit